MAGSPRSFLTLIASGPEDLRRFPQSGQVSVVFAADPVRAERRKDILERPVCLQQALHIAIHAGGEGDLL